MQSHLHWILKFKTQVIIMQPVCRTKHASFILSLLCSALPSKAIVIVWRLTGKYYYNYFMLFYVLCATSSMGTVNKNNSYSLVGPWVCLVGVFRLHDLSVYFLVCFVLPWSFDSFPFMSWHWRNKLFAPSSLLWVRSWLHPFKGHCEQKAMRDEGGYLCRWSSTTE